MKHAKRILAVLLTAVLLAAMLVIPGTAVDQYTPVSFSIPDNLGGLTETLTVTAGNPAVTYTLKLGGVAYYHEDDPHSNTKDINYDPSEATLTAAQGLDGKDLATVSFTVNEALVTSTKFYDAIDATLAQINALSFDRPCILYWPVIKESNSTDDDLSNYDHNKATDGSTETVFVLRVDDVGGYLNTSFGFNTKNQFNAEQCEQWMKSSQMLGIITDFAETLLYHAAEDAADNGDNLPDPAEYEKLIPIEGVHLVYDLDDWEEPLKIVYPDTIVYKDNWDEILLNWWKGTGDFASIDDYNELGISSLLLENGHFRHEDPGAAAAVEDIDSLAAYMLAHPDEMKEFLNRTTNPPYNLPPESAEAAREYENRGIEPYEEGYSFARTFPYGGFGSAKFTKYEDEYPISKSLTVAKQVTGNQGRKDQYFKFTAVLMLPSFPESVSLSEAEAILEEITANLTFTGDNSVTTMTEELKKYKEEFPVGYDNLHPTIRGPALYRENNKPAELTGDLYTLAGNRPYSTIGYWVYEFDFWLKHDESVTIGNIPANTKYFAVFERPSVPGDIEDKNIRTNYYIDGYTVSNVLTYEDENGSTVSVDGTIPLTTQFQQFQSSATATFTNKKETPVPTGVLLQAAAPIAGVALALALAAVVLLSKKRRRDRA